MDGNTTNADASRAAGEAAFNALLGIEGSARKTAVSLVPVGGGGNGALRLSDAPKSEDAVAEQAEPAEKIAAHMRRTFRANAAHRRESGVDERLENCRLMKSRRYSQDELDKIRAIHAEPLYLGYADTTATAVSATLGEINTGSEKPWTLRVTPRADVPQAVKESSLELSMEQVGRAIALIAAMVQRGVITDERAKEILPPKGLQQRRVVQALDEAKRIDQEVAEEACAAMEKLIWDQMVEGGFNQAYADMVEYLVVYGTAALIGPIPRTRRKLVGEDGKTGSRRLKMKDVVSLEFEAVSPVDMYPSPGAREAGDGELVIKRRYNPSDIASYARGKGGEAKGWRKDAIDAILMAFPNGGAVEEEGRDWQSYDYEKESSQVQNRSCQIEGLEYFGEVRGSELLDIGMTKDAGGKALKEDEFYEVDCITIMDLVVFCRILEPEVGRPVSKMGFYRMPESWWSEGPMDKVRDVTRIINGFVRALVVNMAQCSGPQVIVDPNRIEGDTTLVPWKVWLRKKDGMATNDPTAPIQVLNIPSVLGDLLKGISFFKTERDELSGLPAFTYGNTAGVSSGVTRTASVLSMLTEGATRGMKHAVRQIDAGVRALVMRCYRWNMLHHDDERVKVGDVTCDPSGVMGYVYVENNYNKVLQFLQMTGNQTDMQIIGAKGRAYLLRQIAEMLSINPDKTVPTAEALEMIDAMNKAKEEAALAQQQANVEATEAGTEGVEQRNAMGGEPSAPVAQAPEEETAQTPGVGAGVNGMRAQQAAARRMVESGVPGGGNGARLTPQQRGIIAATQGNPRERAAQGARSAVTRSRR